MAAALKAAGNGKYTEYAGEKHFVTDKVYTDADFGRDARDAIVSLEELCRAARRAGIEISPYLKEIAALSDDDDEHGMGSMKNLILQRVIEANH